RRFGSNRRIALPPVARHRRPRPFRPVSPVRTTKCRRPPGRAARVSFHNLLLQLDVPVRRVEERLPRLVLPLTELHRQERAPLRLLRLADQRHASLPPGPPPLADVSVHPGADDVLP